MVNRKGKKPWNQQNDAKKITEIAQLEAIPLSSGRHQGKGTDWIHQQGVKPQWPILDIWSFRRYTAAAQDTPTFKRKKEGVLFLLADFSSLLQSHSALLSAGPATGQ